MPGAYFVDLDAELAGVPGPRGRHPMPTAWSVEAALRRCGVDEDTAVVVYDQGRSMRPRPRLVGVLLLRRRARARA